MFMNFYHYLAATEGSCRKEARYECWGSSGAYG